MIQYGILCTASISERYIEGIRESRNGSVYGVASRNLDNARKYAERLNIPHFYGSYEELIADPTIDVVYIPLLNSLHYKYALLSLQNHKHVVVEKPFVVFPEEAVHLFEVAKENNCFLMEAQKAVFLPVTNKVKELIEEGAIGDVKFMDFKASFVFRFTLDHWMFDVSQGGGTLYGSATYTIEYLMHLFGVLDMQKHCFFIKSPASADEFVNFQLKFKDMVVSSSISSNVVFDNKAVFYGTKGRIEVPNYWKARELTLFNEDGEQKFSYPCKSEFVYEVDHINDCIEKGLIESPVMNKEKTITVVQMVDDFYKTL